MAQDSAYRTDGPPTYTTTGNARELRILRLLARYDLLPSNFIQHELGNYEATKQALRRLRKGHYIGLPDLPRDEKLAYIPRNGFYVYELKARGKALLVKEGVVVNQGGNDHYKHRLLRSEIEFLLDRAPLEVKGPEHILAHRNCPPATRTAPFPFRVPLKPTLEPDITRGFGRGDTFLFVHIEVDRGTEPVLSSNARQSIKSKVQRYADYFARGMYKTHFGFVVRPSVLFITTRENTQALKDAIKTFCGTHRDRFYLTTIPEKPLPTHNLFAPWQGVDGALDLMETLHADRPKDARSIEGAAGAQRKDGHGN